MIRALIFDFDGLILDTEGPAYQSWVEIFEELGADLPVSAWETWVGGSPHGFDPCGYLEGQLGRAVDREGLTERQLEREAELIEAQGVLPGVEEYVADAKRLGLKLGLASSSDCEWVYRYLEKLGLREAFDSVKCADDVERVKPEPDLYLAVLEGLGLRPEEAIALGDSPNGITSAQAAGLFCVVVPNPLTRELDTGHADLHLDSLADLPLEALLFQVHREGGLGSAPTTEPSVHEGHRCPRSRAAGTKRPGDPTNRSPLPQMSSANCLSPSPSLPGLLGTLALLPDYPLVPPSSAGLLPVFAPSCGAAR